MLPVDNLSAPLSAPRPDSSSGDLMEAAKEMEAAFLAEMLKAAGLGETPSEFGGGAGEDQFASFLRQAQAEAIVETGGIGLAQSIFENLTRGQTDGS